MTDTPCKTDRRTLSPRVQRAVRHAPCALLMLAFIILATFLGVYAAALASDGWFRGSLDELVPLATVGVVVPAAIVVPLLAMALRRISRPSAPVPQAGLRAVAFRLAATVDRLVFSWRFRAVVFAALILMLCWSFWIVAFYPGSMIYDTYYQITQFYPRGDEVRAELWAVPGRRAYAQFSDHHPIFDTLLYGWFAYTSDQLTGSWNTGIFIFSVLQALGTAIAFSVAFAYLRHIGAPRGLTIGLFATICVVPVFGGYAPVVIKDMLFSGIYVAWFTMAIAVVHTRGDALRSVPFLLGNIVLALLLSLTKKTGIYIVIPTMVVYAVVYRRVWWRSLVPAALSAALMWGVMPNVVFPALDVVPGGRQEMLGTLFQQTARYVALHGVEMSASERRAIDDVLVVDTLNERYQPEWADSVKYEYNASATDEQIQEYLKVWAAQGLRHPEVYVEATLSMLSGFASPSEPIQLRIDTWDEDHDGTSLLRQPWQLEGLREAARDVWDAWVDIPVIGLAMTCPPYVIWIPLFALWLFICRMRRWLPIMMPVLLSMASVVLSPMYDARYACALIFTAPLLIAVLGVAFAEREAESAGNRASVRENKKIWYQ